MIGDSLENLGRLLLLALRTPEEQISNTRALVAGMIVLAVMLLFLTLLANLAGATQEASPFTWNPIFLY